MSLSTPHRHTLHTTLAPMFGFLAAGSVAPTAWADAPSATPDDSVVSLPQIKVDGEETTSAFKVDRVTSAKISQPLLDAPQSVTIVPQQVLEEQNAQTLQEVLRNVPGITFMSGEGNLGWGDLFSIRGFSSEQSLTVQPGRRIPRRLPALRHPSRAQAAPSPPVSIMSSNFPASGASAMFKPRNVLKLGVLFAALVLGHAETAAAHEVTDVLGRKVEVKDDVKRVVLGEGRLISAFALLDKDAPFQRIVGWQNDLKLLDPHTYNAYVAKFATVKDIPLIGQASEQSVSAEEILSLKPDLAVFSISGHGPTEHSAVADVLAKAGIPVLFVDFRINPVQGTHTSMIALGQALGREAQANAFLAFYDQHIKVITDAVATLPAGPRPSVFLELLAGAWQAPGHTTGKSGMGEVIKLVGGRNIAADVVPGALGDISVEYALKADPDVYVATGNHKPGLILGAGVSPDEAREAFDRVLARPEFANLRAIREGNAHGLWHDFYNSPYNLLAIEALAKWVHPQLFATLDPQATMEQINQQFLGMPLQGAYWIDAKTQ